MRPNERTLPLQGLRVLLMMGIVLLHAYGKPVLGSGGELVSFFFVVSGFLYRAKLSWAKYVKKKVLGIFPVYWTVLLLYLLECYHAGSLNVGLGILRHILLVQSWIPIHCVEYSFRYVGVAWFLSSLLFCYIFSPLLYKCVSRGSTLRAIVGLVGTFLIVCFIHHFDGDNGYGLYFAYISPYCRVFEYMMGMFLWGIVQEKKYTVLSKEKEILALLFIAVYWFVICKQVLGGATCGLHVVCIAFCYLFGSRVTNLLYANKWIVWLAPYIMFVYLCHQALILHFDSLRMITGELLANVVDVRFMMVVYCWVGGIIFGLCFGRIKTIILSRNKIINHEYRL